MSSTQPETTNKPFSVYLALSEKEYEVPADKSILKVLEEAGETVISSCQEGTCGTCETPVISGEVDHRCRVLDDEEREANETMMICVSRACGNRLELDM
ncbi:MAG: 2Fe-2S iron-sulfur cluster binding domain-containing protein [Corynebacterium sp.]|uniref:2Fe-2S iron-sulfur cluster-binding protein n=1 Tax=uncultured Corynebacterium sp. TaxID=159447 RepID=UPI0017E4200E|nr:2Fe-2S iron-sulfur cluster binding domain-containing protein [uncultured Corynebacterium sp.]NLZ58829.1 2Fe-2S iron-sulfur cluster binding domain-containing protein [Corynebacterium sp.]